MADLNRGCLFIQVPPGSGKTYTASHLIVELMRQGKKIAVTSNSHKAINNLLGAVERVSQGAGFKFKGLKKFTNPDQRLGGQLIKETAKNEDMYSGMGHTQLVAGTAWLFASPRLELAFNHLFVDEAGQVSLANLVALSTCSKKLVLLGDQMQLAQPTQGVHPEGWVYQLWRTCCKAATTLAPEAGIFLKDTWRVPPDVCRFISDAVYDGRLQAQTKNANQRLLLSAKVVEGGLPALRPTGVQFIEVQHIGCAQRSDVDAQVVRALHTSLLQQQYTDWEGVLHQVALVNILADIHAEREVARVMVGGRTAGQRRSADRDHTGRGQGLRRPRVDRCIARDESHAARGTKHRRARVGGAGRNCKHSWPRHLAAKKEAHRARIWMGQDRGQHSPGHGAWNRAGGPDICADNGCLQPHTNAHPGANPSADGVRGQKSSRTSLKSAQNRK